MLLSNAAPTPYDVRFKLLGVPVRIAPMFWLVCVLLGGRPELAETAIWMVAVLVSVLVHELGHALVQRAFGGTPEIVLYALGGYASAPGVRDSWWRQVLISLAGPLAGFALAGLVFAGVSATGGPQTRLGRIAVGDLLWINVWWGVLNLAPVWPLDGGRIARELGTQFFKPSVGVVASLWLSMLTAIGLATYAFARTGSLWSVALFGMLAYQSYETLTRYRASRGR